MFHLNCDMGWSLRCRTPTRKIKTSHEICSWLCCVLLCCASHNIYYIIYIYSCAFPGYDYMYTVGALFVFVLHLSKISVKSKELSCTNKLMSTWWRHQLKHFPRYWPFVRGIHRSPVNSPHIGQWRGALMFSLICTSINSGVNNGDAGDLRRHRAHYDVIIMNDRSQCRELHAYTASHAICIWLTLRRRLLHYLVVDLTRMSYSYFISTEMSLRLRSHWCHCKIEICGREYDNNPPK